MKQIAINGLTPEQEPKAAEIAAVSTYARAHGVTTVYAETLASPAIAATVAREAGARVATLDPIEGLTKQVERQGLLRGHALQPQGPAGRSGLFMTGASHAPDDGSQAIVSLRSAVLRVCRPRGRLRGHPGHPCR